MGYKHYISVRCEGEQIGYNYKDDKDPKKNCDYGIICDNPKYDGKLITVKIKSCENRIYFVGKNGDFDISVKFYIPKGEIYSSENDYDQIFSFVHMPGRMVAFIENQYIEPTYDYEYCLLSRSSYLFDYKFIGLSTSSNLNDENNMYQFNKFTVLYYIINNGNKMLEMKRI